VGDQDPLPGTPPVDASRTRIRMGVSPEETVSGAGYDAIRERISERIPRPARTPFVNGGGGNPLMRLPSAGPSSPAATESVEIRCTERSIRPNGALFGRMLCNL
jgi:hypothetical protein